MGDFYEQYDWGAISISETQNMGSGILCYLASMKAGDVPIVNVCKTKNHLLLCSVILGHLIPCLQGIVPFDFSVRSSVPV